ncbi:MAG TPA: hypothetical protein VMV18_16010 [bacterium]|nr:hypothetical protein [bacterium]
MRRVLLGLAILVTAGGLALACYAFFSEWALDASRTPNPSRAVSRAWLSSSRSQPAVAHIGNYTKPSWVTVDESQRVAAIGMLSTQPALTLDSSLAARLTGGEPPTVHDGEVVLLVRAVRWKENLDVRSDAKGLEILTWGYDCFGSRPEPAPFPIVVALKTPPARVDLAALLECL